jgi:hypothetical protein
MGITITALEVIGASVLAGLGGCFGYSLGKLAWAEVHRRVMDLRGRINGARKRRGG